MLNEQMFEYGSKSSVIRELFAYGLERKKIVGADRVYDFSIGNPSIPAPRQIKEAILELLEEPDINLSATYGDNVSLSADRWLTDGEHLELLGKRWNVIHTPGHTSGCLCYYIEEEGVLFSGDTLFQESVGRTDLPTARPGEIIHSVVEKLFVLPEDTKVYPGHGSSTSIGHEKKYNIVARSRGQRRS